MDPMEQLFEGFVFIGSFIALFIAFSFFSKMLIAGVLKLLNKKPKTPKKTPKKCVAFDSRSTEDCMKIDCESCQFYK